MKWFNVIARDADGCDTAINQGVTRKEAMRTMREWQTDAELIRAGAVRIQVVEEDTDECIEDRPVKVAA